MKKNSRNDLINYLTETGALPEICAELVAERDRDEEKANANRELYAAAHDVVIGALTDKPQTVKELCEAVKLPENMTPSKVQYALRELWAAEVNKQDNGKYPNTYTRK